MAKPQWFDALLFDGNGIVRSLRAPIAQMDTMLKNGIAFPFSLFAMRFDGEVVEETGVGLPQGDPDGICIPIERTLSKTPWRQGGMQAVFAMQQNGKAHDADPRGILIAAARRFADDKQQAKMKPIAAAELEFYLTAQSQMPELYSAEPLARHEAFLDMLAEAMAAANVLGGAMISEYGAGQMEVNLHHGDVEDACLDALLLRYFVRRCAGAHNTSATFLAKPRAKSSGSGMHFHLSFADDGGGYVFADNTKLQNAIAGALKLMPEAMAFFAPFANSYRRFVPGGYAPTTASWGMENRAAAIRLPMATSDEQKRMECRLAGADANPYLVLAVLLSAAHYGLQNTLTPPPQQQGITQSGNSLPMTWRAALDALAAAKILPDYLGAKFVNHYRLLKESEWRHHRDHISDYDREKYAAVI